MYKFIQLFIYFFRVVCALIEASLLLKIASCKVIQDNLELWIPRCEFRIPDSGFQIMDPKYIHWQQYSNIEIKTILISVIGWLSTSIHGQTLDSKALADLVSA